MIVDLIRKMKSTRTFIFLAVIFKVITAQTVPNIPMRSAVLRLMTPECRNFPKISPQECCHIVDLFSADTYASCRSVGDSIVTISNKGSPECAQRTCVLRNNDLLFDNDEIDRDSVRQHLDFWVAKRREYTPAVNAIKENCIGKKPMFGPDLMCEADRLYFCMYANFLNKCPNWVESEHCNSLRAHLESCYPYMD